MINCRFGDNLPVRLGGVYPLEGVMNTSDQYHQPILEALCAFVRDSTKSRRPTSHVQAPTTDVQAALTVISRRSKGAGKVDLHDARIPDAELAAANLVDANLSGAKLTNAYLAGAYWARARL